MLASGDNVRLIVSTSTCAAGVMSGFTIGATTASGAGGTALAVPITASTAGTYRVCFSSVVVGGTYVDVDAAHTLRIVC